MTSWSLNTEFVRAVHTALKRLHRERDLGAHPLSALTAVEEQRCQLSEPETPLGHANALRHVLRAALQSLFTQDTISADLLEHRFWRGESVVQLAYQQAMSESTFYAHQEKAIQAMAHYLWAMEQAAQRRAIERAQHLQRHLPSPTYTRLFGVDDILDRLKAMLVTPDGPCLISIEGLGGLGKTALAHRLACWAASTRFWTDIAWVTAGHRGFGYWASTIEHADGQTAFCRERLLETVLIQLGHPDLVSLAPPEQCVALRTLLQACPYLIVVDNIGRGAEYETLVPQLWELARPTRFILTSCHSLCQYPWVFCCALDELGETDSLALMRHEGETRGITAVAQADDAALHKIYTVTGGNPLAIKLVVGQARDLPLDRVLARLREVAGQPFKELHRFIYWRSWGLLSKDARRVLLAMPAMAAGGACWEDLQATTDLDAARLDAAVKELVEMSLLNTGGENLKWYTIHRLTYSFLMSHLL